MNQPSPLITVRVDHLASLAIPPLTTHNRTTKYGNHYHWGYLMGTNPTGTSMHHQVAVSTILELNTLFNYLIRKKVLVLKSGGEVFLGW